MDFLHAKRPPRGGACSPAGGRREGRNLPYSPTLGGAFMSQNLGRLPKEDFSSRTFRIVRTPYFFIGAKKNGTDRMRVGIVVSKAVHKSAVRRNFLRRQAKDILAGAAFPGMDFLVVMSPVAKDLTKKNLRATLKKTIAASAKR